MNTIRKNNKVLTNLAKDLRNNMTNEEKHLWYDFLKFHKYRFVRQKILGPYIVDFYCAKLKLAIEIDGSQHYTDEGMQKDSERTDFLFKEFNVFVLRFSNLEVMQNFNGVCKAIDLAIEQSLSQQS